MVEQQYPFPVSEILDNEAANSNRQNLESGNRDLVIREGAGHDSRLRDILTDQAWLKTSLIFILLFVPSQVFEHTAQGPQFFYAPSTEFYPGESLLRRPFTEETVPTYMLAIYVTLLVLLTCAAEILILKLKGASTVEAYSAAVRVLVDECNVLQIAYSFVSFVKRGIGRLRPDFLARLETNDSGIVDEGKLSYPSGHTALSCACAAYWTIHLTWRLHYCATPLLRCASRPYWLKEIVAFGKVVLVGLGPAAALFISASRVYDYRHLPSDVNAGAIIGICTAICVWFQR
uniref:Phosphatidate phosphatase n=1 Tax=Tetraselmis sp. GSL018 TaxID=582737 RepID=A0A061RGY1_9CHLO